MNYADRPFWIGLSRVWAKWRSVLLFVKLETVIAWQRKAFRKFWAWKVRRGKPGRATVSAETRALIRRMSNLEDNEAAIYVKPNQIDGVIQPLEANPSIDKPTMSLETFEISKESRDTITELLDRVYQDQREYFHSGGLERDFGDDRKAIQEKADSFLKYADLTDKLELNGERERWEGLHRTREAEGLPSLDSHFVGGPVPGSGSIGA